MYAGKVKSHKDLIVWNKSMTLVEDIYKITKHFPNEETYGLVSQIRRATIAIPTNITEGYHRKHLKEYIQFLYIAKSSASEVETLLDISLRLNYINNQVYGRVNGLLEEILKMLSSLTSQLNLKLSPKR